MVARIGTIIIVLALIPREKSEVSTNSIAKGANRNLDHLPVSDTQGMMEFY